MTIEPDSDSAREPDGEPSPGREPGGEAGRAPGKKIRLDQFLKLRGIAATGGQAKVMVQAGLVKVNGEVETHRGKKLRPGDVVEAEGEREIVGEDLFI